MPEPDVVVIPADTDPDRRVADAAVVLAEVACGDDDGLAIRDGTPWLDAKVALYKRHVPCRAVLVVRADRVEVTLLERSAEGWTRRVLVDPADVVEVACVGLACEVGDLYARTHLG